MRRIAIKRVYEPAAKDDGLRVLVDRLWPRGLSKEEADIDLWAKDVAPSSELRKWFGHDPAKWKEFQAKYRRELDSQKTALQDLVEQAGEQPLTLLYGARDTEHNQAVVLKDVLGSL